MASEQQQVKMTASSTAPDSMSGALKKSLEGPFQMNPYLVDGPKEGYEAKTVKEGLYVRVDMPGVETDNLKVTWDKKKVSFVGEAPKETEHDAGGRTYGGKLDFSSSPVEILDVKTDLKNGLLRMVLVGSGFQPGFSTTSKHFTSYGSVEICKQVISSDMLPLLDSMFVLAPPAEVNGFYPFQVDGATGVLEAKCLYENDFGYFLRIDMPDVPKEGLSFQFRNNLVLYLGEGVESSEYDNSKRRYFGRFSVPCGCCNVKDVKGESKAGVVRMLIEKEKI